MLGLPSSARLPSSIGPFKAIALRPKISFAYFPRSLPLVFSNFSDTAERIEKGLRAFDLATSAGWEKVNLELRSYGILPSDFSVNPKHYFKTLLSSLSDCATITRLIRREAIALRPVLGPKPTTTTNGVMSAFWGRSDRACGDLPAPLFQHAASSLFLQRAVLSPEHTSAGRQPGQRWCNLLRSLALL